jgi:secreted trypsin-like serine protease
MLKHDAVASVTLLGTLVLAACGPLSDFEEYSEMPEHETVTSADMPVIGGSTDTGDPSIVAIFARPPQSNYGSLCTGTVISPRSILTAAHCVDPSAVGERTVFEIYQGTQIGESRPLEVASVSFDPKFDIANVQNGHDIAILTLAKPTTLKPIPVNRKPLTDSNRQMEVRVVGYGANSHRATGAGTKRSVTTSIKSISSLLVQIGNSNQQSCHGDSGGPALQRIGGVETVIGVTSFGLDRSTTNVCFGGGYDTRVDAYSDFIRPHL